MTVLSAALVIVPPGTSVPPAPAGTRLVVHDGTPAGFAQGLGRLLDEEPELDVVLGWDLAFGPLPWQLVEPFRHSPDDAWHPGTLLHGDDPEVVSRMANPLWAYALVPDPSADGVINGRITLRAALLKVKALRTLGSVEPTMPTLRGAGRELGSRWLRRGGLCRQQPSLWAGATFEKEPAASLEDQYRLLRLERGPAWTTYALVRRILTGHAPWREWSARRGALARGPATIPPAPSGAADRDLESVELPEDVRVSVVLPTFGRDRYVAEVLEDIRNQTVPVAQILIADGNPPDPERRDVFAAFADLPLEVFPPTRNGTCAPRNECLARATGNYVWFVDDDSRFDERNLEWHLRALAAYGADVSVGPAYTRTRPELVPSQREFVGTFMDCGTTLCRREILEKAGGFDMQFNAHLMGEDGELGVRFVKAGGVLMNNPRAKRFHYLAPVGGARSSRNNLHRWRRWCFVPRPPQSVYYQGRRHFGPTLALDATLQAWFFHGLRRRDDQPATRSWKIKTAAAEVLALPVSLIRLARSLLIARSMLAQGPEIPPVRSADTVRNTSPVEALR